MKCTILFDRPLQRSGADDGERVAARSGVASGAGQEEMVGKQGAMRDVRSRA